MSLALLDQVGATPGRTGRFRYPIPMFHGGTIPAILLEGLGRDERAY
jgi:hypothetical protein